MWKELKFAVNWNAGDTKPIRQGRSSRWINNNKENYNNYFAKMTKFQVKIAVNAEQEQR